jgi:hypothetical protein
MAKGTPADPLDPRFLIEHAERLTTSSGGGRPPTIDSRRAASAAYYSAYHATTRGIAQFLFGEAWVHGVRLLSHAAVIDATRSVTKLGAPGTPDPGGGPDQVRSKAIWSLFQSAGGAGSDLLDVMDAIRSLKIEREIADYDRVGSVSRAAAQNLLASANSVLAFFETARVDDADTRIFFSLAALKAKG